MLTGQRNNPTSIYIAENKGAKATAESCPLPGVKRKSCGWFYEKADYEKRFILAARTQRWAVTMTKVAIRQALSRAPFPRWHLVSFTGPGGKESRGVVDLIAIRKSHGAPRDKMKRGDAFQIVLIQVKGGYAARPTAEDGERLRAVARWHRAQGVLLASWKKGKAARFFSLQSKSSTHEVDWVEVSDIRTMFS